MNSEVAYGFMTKCAEAGLTHDQSVELLKEAFDWRALLQDPRLWGALGGAGLGAAGGYMAGRNPWVSALGGIAGGLGGYYGANPLMNWLNQQQWYQNMFGDGGGDGGGGTSGPELATNPDTGEAYGPTSVGGPTPWQAKDWGLKAEDFVSKGGPEPATNPDTGKAYSPTSVRGSTPWQAKDWGIKAEDFATKGGPQGGGTPGPELAPLADGQMGPPDPWPSNFVEHPSRMREAPTPVPTGGYAQARTPQGWNPAPGAYLSVVDPNRRREMTPLQQQARSPQGVTRGGIHGKIAAQTKQASIVGACHLATRFL